MSDAGSAQDGRLQASHEQRSRFERLAYNAALGIVVAAATILVFGIAWPPPVPDTKMADWGAAIVHKSNEAVPVLLTLLGVLLGGVATTLTRGHMDARLDGRSE